ncbi:phage tail-collar fiber domain-containing protein [Fusobacterium animalis]|uniref:phage tail-collar fiber domain-containing protein n=1 Tax=Fusobacterium animalis TaxID=76859 RepID=UPI0034DF27BA
MKFNGITKKGREYLAKIQAENKPVNFSKIKIGDGKLDDYDNPAELESLVNQKVEKGILSLKQESDTVILTTNIDNVSLRTGYYPREIGVFVNDNGQEIMYYYMNDGDETSWIPPETEGPFKIELKLNLIASNAQSIIVPNSGKDLYITKEFLEVNYTKNGGYRGTSQEIEDRVVAAVGKEDGKFPLTEAIKGNVYYFPGNKKFYICKENLSRRVSIPDGNFEDLSIWENCKRLENLISSKTERDNAILKIGNVVIENISIPGREGIRTAAVKTSFKNIISISLTPYITYGQQVDSTQSIHDSSDYIISSKSLRFYCNGNQTVDVCIIGLI